MGSNSEAGERTAWEGTHILKSGGADHSKVPREFEKKSETCGRNEQIAELQKQKQTARKGLDYVRKSTSQLEGGPKKIEKEDCTAPTENFENVVRHPKAIQYNPKELKKLRKKSIKWLKAELSSEISKALERDRYTKTRFWKHEQAQSKGTEKKFEQVANWSERM